jgi:DNA-binding CsgD family transcriptional regulator/sugar lactone lactonase YvrE
MAAGMALTTRELEVAALVAEGLTNKEIAGRLFLSERTAEGHVEHIRDKLSFSNRSQIASWYTGSRTAPSGAAHAAPAVPARLPVTAPATRRSVGQRSAIFAAGLVVVIVVVAVVLARPSVPTLVLAAGLGTDGNSGDGGPAVAAQFSEINSMFFDADGRLVVMNSQASPGLAGHFIDQTHIRRIAPDGTITSLAGDGTVDAETSANAVALRLNAGAHGALGPAGAIFVAFGYEEPLTLKGKLGRIDADGTFHLLINSAIPGYGDSSGSTKLGRLVVPQGLAVDREGTVFLVDSANSVVRAMSVDGTIRIVAGTGERGNAGDDGPATAATLFAPLAIALSPDRSLFIADTNNDRVRRIDHGGTMRSVVDGLSKPSSLAFGPDGVLYVADTGNARILRVTSDGVVTTVAGPDGLVRPTALAVDASGTLFIGDSGLHQILKLVTR